jgi:hypothetical protein
MLKQIILLAAVAALATFLTPAKVDAYGAAHVGYTHVGPNGVYHEGATVAGGYGGEYRGGAAYGGEYRGGAAYGGEYRGGAAYGDYHYTTGYQGGVAVSGGSYGYVR